MKKTVAIVLAAALCCTASIPAFASEVSTDGGQASTRLTYAVGESYVVTIPETVALGQDLVISSDKANTEPGQSVKVRITGLTEDGAAELVRTDDEEYRIAAQARQNGAVISNSTVVASFANITDKTDADHITFDAPEAVSGGEIKAGSYTGTLTFTVSYEAE